MDFKTGQGIEYEEGDLIISGGELHFVEDIPTANISSGTMDDFLQDEADRLEREKAGVAARAAARTQDEVVQAPPDRPNAEEIRAAMNLARSEDTPPTEVQSADADDCDAADQDAAREAPKRPTAEEIRAAMKGPAKDTAPTEQDSPTESEGTPTVTPSETEGPASPVDVPTQRPSRRSAATTSRRQAPAPKKKATSLEKWLYVFIGVCVVAGAVNFWIRSQDKDEGEAVPKAPELSRADLLWLATEEKAAEASRITRRASRENASGDKAEASAMYKEAQALWQDVFTGVDKIAELGVDFDAAGYRRWQKKISKWSQDMRESNKLQTLGDDDDWDYEEEQRRAKEKNRLDEENEDNGDE